MASSWNILYSLAVAVAIGVFFIGPSCTSADAGEGTGEYDEHLLRSRRGAAQKRATKFHFDQPIYEVTIRESSIVGTRVVHVSASFIKLKANRVKQFKYRLKDKRLRKAPVEEFPFAVVMDTGEILLSGPISNVTDRFEFKIEAFVSGSKKSTDKASVIVNIDRRPTSFSFGSTFYLGYIEENVYNNVNVTLEVLDVNEHGSPLEFSIVEVIPEFYPTRFGVDEEGNIYVRHPLDREAQSIHYLTVQVEQDGNVDETYVQVQVVDQNDNAPFFMYDQLRMHVHENVNLTFAGNTFVTAYDNDVGENAEIRYEIESGGEGLIYINHETGQLYNYIDLDYETVKRIRLTVAAYSGEFRTTCKVYIYIRDVNDNPPIVNDFEVFYNGHPHTLGGAEVAKIPVRDVDITGRLRYGILIDDGRESRESIVDPQAIIEVDANTGVIRISPRIQDSEDIEIDADIGIYVFDGLHATPARCRIVMTGVTDQMVENSVSAHILNVTENEFLLNGGLQSLRNATMELLDASSVTIFNIEEFVANSSHFLNISFSARYQNGAFVTPVEILNALYFQKDLIEDRCGFHISPAEEDTCVSEMCNKRQRCVTRKTLKETQTSYEARVGDNFLRFYGIPPLVEHWCECMETETDGNCSSTNPCDSYPCMNKGMCYAKELESGYGCICPKGFTGDNCGTELVRETCFPGACGPDEECENLPKGSFHCVCKRAAGCPNEHTWYFPKGSYLAFPSLIRKTSMKFSLKFSTHQESGLLLYLGRYSFMYDFLALEIIRGEVALTFNAGRFIMRVKVGIPGGVNDGRWHMIELKYHEKVVRVVLDECRHINQGSSDHPCAAHATQSLDVTTWFLDVNTPFMLGSLPEGDSRIINNDFEGCIKDVYINNRKYSADDTLRTKDTEQGCPWYKQSRPQLPVNDDTFA